MKKEVVLNVGIGCITGIVMALLVIYLMDLTVYKLFTTTFLMACVIVCALPHCFFAFKNGKLKIAPLVMIVVSFCITIIYGFFVSSQYNQGMTSLFRMSLLLHFFSVVSYLCGFLLQKRKNKRDMVK